MSESPPLDLHLYSSPFAGVSVQEISCSSKELLQTEGTVLHHISHAIKHNHVRTL